MPEWEIRHLKNPDALQPIEELQNAIWPGSEREIIPVHMLTAAVNNGGLVLGAYAKERLIGMLFGFPGFYLDEDRLILKHCSHMLGVHPDWRDSGLGFALKIEQRQFVLSQDLNLVTWTYDPLLSRNAYLNISKLGAICHTYHRSEYGKMSDGLNAGLDSDRFLVEWWLESSRVQKKLDEPQLFGIQMDDLMERGVEIMAVSGNMHPPVGFPKMDQALLLIEIPYDFKSLKEADIRLARAWRQASRELFEFVFLNGYGIVDFLVEQARSYYVLESLQ